MLCKKCGKESPDSSKFCIECGALVELGESGNKMSEKEMFSSSEFADKAKIASKEFTDKAKAASSDALNSFKDFVLNPVSKFSLVYDTLGKKRAMQVGIVFAVFFDICVIFGAKKILGLFLEDYSGLSVNLLILGAVPVVSIAIASALIRKLFRAQSTFESDIYIAGATLLPLGFFILLTGILGIGNVEIIIAINLFAVCYTILMLFSGCTQIHKISETSTLIAIPLILLLSVYVSKIIIASRL